MKISRVLLQTCLVATLFAPGARAFAQDTWGNLKFGMMPQDIEDKLYAQGFTLKQDPAGGYRVDPEYKWQPTPDGHELMFKVAIAGTATGGLQKVVLMLDPANLRARVEELPVVANYAITPMQTYLTGKYGQPSSQVGTCNLSGQPLVEDLINQEEATCKETWTSGGQIISAHWFYFGGRNLFTYLLTFLPVSPPAPIPSAPAASSTPAAAAPAAANPAPAESSAPAAK